MVQPHENEFPSMLEGLVVGPIQHIERPNVLAEPWWKFGGVGPCNASIENVQTSQPR